MELGEVFHLIKRGGGTFGADKLEGAVAGPDAGYGPCIRNRLCQIPVKTRLSIGPSGWGTCIEAY